MGVPSWILFSGERHWHSIYEKHQKERKLRRGKVAFSCSGPVTWDVSVAEGCIVTGSAVYLPKKRPGPPVAGEMPTCANLNLCGGSGSRVRWHSDNEGLFGKREESKLIVSRSFGVSALNDASSSWLHHGDLLVMDGCCQDENLHCTDPLQGGERVNITFRWIRNHVPRCPLATDIVCCLPKCAKGSLVSPNMELFLPGLLSVVLLALLGWGFFFLIALFSSWLELRCRTSRCFWLSCRVRGGRSSRQNSGSTLLGWFLFRIQLVTLDA